MSSEPIIVVKDLSKRFGTVDALNGVSLEVDRGKVIVVIGPSGSGKSTLLRCVNHLETPSGGEVWIEAID
jgi:polar amino acid transport system ATP-binding protein